MIGKMLVKTSTGKTVNETATALHAAVQANQFDVMQVHNLKETMVKKGVEFERECLIFEVCQPRQAKKVLDREHERLYRSAMPDLDLRGERQDYIGISQANHSSRDVRFAATKRGREGSGGHDRKNHDGGGVRLIDCAFGSSRLAVR